ncbi:hypothetical protein [Silvibacterium acidisoli]|uniref:hypothetical protein n=1 Tax=Acidobacteriaceae bacterium ZG23-2 TaxID=2883246 RepID=UPI00406C7749
MSISEQDQISTDFDWFAVDLSGYIGHFATAGFKNLPASVASSAKDLELITTYFRTSAPMIGPAAISSGIGQFVPGLGIKVDERRYTQSFRFMAERGLFSFDIETYPQSGTVYFLVAAPTVPVHLRELPDFIQAILCRTVFANVDLASCLQIAYKNTLVL